MKIERVEILGCGFEWCILNAQKEAHDPIYKSFGFPAYKSTKDKYKG